MLFARLDLIDFVVIAVIVLVIAGSGAVSAAMRKTGGENLRRVEAKLDFIMEHLGIEYTFDESLEWQRLAAQPGQKIAAIRAYREITGCGIVEAKTAVEEYMARI